MPRLFAHLAILAVLLLGPAAGAPAQSRGSQAAPPVAATADGGIRIGAATARVALVEYVSYTCPHCATYDGEASATLRRDYVARGNTSVEVRPLVRDLLDLAAAVVARCGTVNRFFDRHHALMARQADMFAAAQRAQPGWAAVPREQRLARVARDTGIIAAVAGMGVTEAQASACLADQAAIERIIAIGERGAALGVEGTPTFLINGALQQRAHSWAALRPRLDAALAAR